MPNVIDVTIHRSQFPEQVLSDLRLSLHSRQVNHKFHYDSYKQTQKWLELHQVYSPSRTDPDCAATYDLSFAAAVTQIRPARVHLIGLGCGGGQKDTRLLRLLAAKGKELSYTPTDVSTAMVLVAHQAASHVVAASYPLVCDLLSADDLTEVLDSQTPPSASRLITFFGMMPNFEPSAILPKLKKLVRPGDHLLLSANLAPGDDYAAGVGRVLPLYANALTSDWLLTFLLDLGVDRDDGGIEWEVEPCPKGSGLLRIAASFRFSRECSLRIGGDKFGFCAGDKLGLFFSYRHTPDRLRALLENHGLGVTEEWITASGEEGVFLCG